MEASITGRQTKFNNITRHLGYWVLFVLFFTLLWGTYDHDYKRSLLIQMFGLPSKLILVYGTLEWILPFFFLKRKYIVAILFYLVLLLAVTFLVQRPIMLLYVEPTFLTDWQSSGMFSITELANTALDINISAIVPVIYTLFRFWEKEQHKTQTLEKKQEDQKNKKYMYLKVEKSLQKIYLDHIQYVESLKNYIKIKTTEKEIVVYKSLTSIEEALPNEHFLRVHRSFIVGVDFIDSFSPSKLTIRDTTIPVGRKYKNEVKEKLGYF